MSSIVALALAVIFYHGGPMVQAGEPLELVKSVGDHVIAVLKDPKLKAPDRKNQRIERLKEIINPVFDDEEMARRTLGGHWRRRSPSEQQEFLTRFRSFLEKISAERVDLYEGERVVFGRETLDQDYAEVEGDQRQGRRKPGALSPQTCRWQVESLRRRGAKHQHRQQLPLPVRPRDYQVIL